MNISSGLNPVANSSLKRSEQTKSTDPKAFKKAFGEKSLDQVLNKISDPNYGNKKKRVHGVGNPELGKDAFFKLMLTQLKQQDPTNPLKSHEMAAQLAQFSSVEQLTNIGKALDQMGATKDKNQFQVLNLIGKVVGGDSSKIKRVLGDQEHNIEFQLGGQADRVEVVIKNSTGSEVKKYELENLQPGVNKVIWNGLDHDGKETPVGDFKAEIRAWNGKRSTVVQTKFKGTVDGVEFSKEGPLLKVQGKSLRLRDVTKVEKNSIQSAPPKNAMNPQVKPTGPQPKASMMASPVPVVPKVAPQPQKPGGVATMKRIFNPNKKVSKGAYEKPPVVANLDQANLDNQLRSSMNKNMKAKGM